MPQQRIPDDNIITLTDSYKFTHDKQYPPGTSKIYSYLEARTGGRYEDVTFFGLQYQLIRYLAGEVVTRDKIEEASEIAMSHVGYFNRTGWEFILNQFGGRLPLRIRALPEGMVVPEGTCLLDVENLGGEPTAFLTNALETLTVQNWYPCTVATNSREAKAIILKYLVETGDPALIDFKLHDFGCRGTSSMESAMIGGAAHLLNFKGTDTVPALRFIRNYYNTQAMPGFSIPAAEHSTITSWGRSREFDAYENIMDQFKDFPFYAIVSDSWNIYDAIIKGYGGRLKDKILGHKGTLVVRPDSGDPVQVVSEVVSLLFTIFGGSINDKGYKVLDSHVRVIQGDGITNGTIPPILDRLKMLGFSADNVAFGMGGGLLQMVNRDDQRFAQKAAEAIVNGEAVPVFKQPATDPTKNSKKGRQAVVRRLTGEINTIPEVELRGNTNLLVPVFDTGDILKQYNWEEVLKRAGSPFASKEGKVLEIAGR